MEQTDRMGSKQLEPDSGKASAYPGRDLFDESEWQAVAAVLSLSDRELQVAKLLIEGRTRDQIGHQIRKPNGDYISPGTVRVYIDRLYKKAQVDDRIALVLRVVRILLGRDG